MKIPSSIIKEYLIEKFQKYHIAGEEFLVDSLFAEDHKMHMSINMETGLWQCFKSKEKGSFIHLVSFVEGTSYDEASKSVRRKLLGTPEMLFAEPTRFQTPAPLNPTDISQELENFKILDMESSMYSESLIEKIACKFVRSRGLTGQRFYIATGGNYANRLIIPFEDYNGMFYFQARNLMGTGMKYLNPTYKEYGVKSSEILFPFDSYESYVVVVEGPLDAIALQSLGVNSTSIQGSFMSYFQLKEIADKKIILSFDNDEAGRNGMAKALQLVRTKNLPSPYTVQPPEKFKDWNEFTTVATKNGVLKHINSKVQRMDYRYRFNALLS